MSITQPNSQKILQVEREQRPTGVVATPGEEEARLAWGDSEAEKTTRGQESEAAKRMTDGSNKHPF